MTNSPADSAGITQLLAASSGGDPEALNRLMPLVYDNLRAIAHRRLGLERPAHTLNTTALVHEAYLKLIDHKNASWKDRTHFFAVSARIIRNLLIDHARERNAAKRGGNAVRLPLADELYGDDSNPLELLALDEALTELGRLDPRLERLVEYKFFGGMNMREAAEALDVSLSTAERDWRRARAYLSRALT